MINVGLCLIIQFCFAFGMAGLLWPEKLMPIFDLLMFPWAATHRAMRVNCGAAIGLALLLLVKLHFGIG